MTLYAETLLATSIGSNVILPFVNLSPKFVVWLPCSPKSKVSTTLSSPISSSVSGSVPEVQPARVEERPIRIVIEIANLIWLFMGM